MKSEMTLNDHAIFWWKSKGVEIPPDDSPEWQRMYEDWVEWAFADFRSFSDLKS